MMQDPGYWDGHYDGKKQELERVLRIVCDMLRDRAESKDFSSHAALEELSARIDGDQGTANTKSGRYPVMIREFVNLIDDGEEYWSSETWPEWRVAFLAGADALERVANSKNQETDHG